jgi:DNA-binding MarR family transcriptional regulator
VLLDRDCLVAFAAMALCCDASVHAHEMGYHHGGGSTYITSTGVTRRTGLSRAAAERALQRLEAAGLTEPERDGDAWRTGVDVLTPASP